MNRQLLRRFTLGVLALVPAFGSLPVSADETIREGTCAGSQDLFARRTQVLVADG